MQIKPVTYLHSILPAIALVLCLTNCRQKRDNTSVSFYYWRTTYGLSESEKKTLNENQVKELYVRLFDLDVWVGSIGPMPLAVIANLDTTHTAQEIIPVVFITNRTFKLLNDSLVKELASKTFKKIKNLCPHFNQIQMDCDWTEKTSHTYFLFLKELKKLMKLDEILSATIRLHQVKFYAITGVPPVDRGMLMFYNMGDVGNVNEANSIYDRKKAKLYTSYLSSYPLTLDVALPIFSWQVQFRDGKIVNLFAKQNGLELNTADFRARELNTFVALKDQVHAGKFIRECDVIRVEQVSEEDLLEATDILKQNLKNENRTVVFYDLDNYNLKQYDKSLFRKISDHIH